MQEELKDIILKSFQKAQEHEKIGNMGKSYAYYTVIAELCPSKRLEIENSFVDVLCEWGIQLAYNKRFKDVKQCYERSLDIYPKNTRMLNNYAAHLLRNNNPMEAINYLKRALQIDPNFLPALRNLQNALSMAVDRWHFPMLNDKRRNHAFDRAIQKRVSQGYDTVLDVGTGTGLLSLYARDAGAKKVYACECSKIMAKIATNIFEANNAKDIKLFCKYSSDLHIPNDIPERLKLVVTETFDAGLFGELVIPSIIDVHTKILHRNGVVIPASATLYVAAVECEYIRYRSSVILPQVKNACGLNFDNMSVLPDDEFYDTETVENVKINYVTEPQILLSVDFNNLSELQEFSRDGIKNLISVKCRYDGIIDGLVTWFKLHLDEEITIDSSEGKSCWQLAVFPASPYSCKQGDPLSIQAEMSTGKLKCSYTPSKAQVTYNRSEYEFLYHVPKEVITFLNDFEYLKLLKKTVKFLNTKEIENILDTSPFPILGIILLKENSFSKLLYVKTENSNLRLFIETIAESNNVKEKVCFVNSYTEIKCPLDIVYIHDFDIKGELKNCGEVDNYEFFRCLLKPDGILLPQEIFLVGQLVYSEELSKMVYVKDSNVQRMSMLASSTSSSEKVIQNSDEDEEDEQYDFHKKDNIISNYKIANYINQFKINSILDLNSSLYLCEPLSDLRILTDVTKSGSSEKIVNFGKVSAGRSNRLPNSLICWYKIQITPEYEYHTKRTGSFMNHMAIVLENELWNVSMQNKEVQIKILQSNSLVNVQVL